jgi:hypothetical protein
MPYEYAGIEFSIGSEEAELIKRTAASPGALMPDADIEPSTISTAGAYAPA